MLDGHDWAMLLRTAYLAVHRAADAVMARHGLTADQFVLLTLLSERDGVMQQDLVGRSGSDPNTVRAMLVLLERRGLVKRRAHAEDGRARCVELTARGRSLQAKLWKASETLRNQITAAIPAGVRRGVESALEKLTTLDNLHTPPSIESGRQPKHCTARKQPASRAK